MEQENNNKGKMLCTEKKTKCVHIAQAAKEKMKNLLSLFLTFLMTQQVFFYRFIFSSYVYLAHIQTYIPTHTHIFKLIFICAYKDV